MKTPSRSSSPSRKARASRFLASHLAAAVLSPVGQPAASPPALIIDGTNASGDWEGDMNDTKPPFCLFCPDTQTIVAGPFPTRAKAREARRAIYEDPSCAARYLTFTKDAPASPVSATVAPGRGEGDTLIAAFRATFAEFMHYRPQGGRFPMLGGKQADEVETQARAALAAAPAIVRAVNSHAGLVGALSLLVEFYDGEHGEPGIIGPQAIQKARDLLAADRVAANAAT